MTAKHYIAVFVVTLLVCFFTAKMYISNQISPVVFQKSVMDEKPVDGPDIHVLEYIRQRNNVSRLLNQKQKMIGQMECEKIATGAGVSKTGGWCKKSSQENHGEHMTDRPLVPALAELFTGKFVASFGDGPGRYKQLLLATGKLKGYDAYDGAPFTEETSEGRVTYLDLTLPQYGLPVYDWIMSLEVAEHIPSQFESMFIDNIARHAKEGVVLSWAVPGQGGYSHVNNKPFEYVVSVMERQGFKHDDNESQKLRQVATLPWLKSNTNVYRRTTKIEVMDMEQNA